MVLNSKFIEESKRKQFYFWIPMLMLKDEGKMIIIWNICFFDCLYTAFSSVFSKLKFIWEYAVCVCIWEMKRSTKKKKKINWRNYNTPLVWHEWCSRRTMKCERISFYFDEFFFHFFFFYFQDVSAAVHNNNFWISRIQWAHAKHDVFKWFK